MQGHLRDHFIYICRLKTASMLDKSLVLSGILMFNSLSSRAELIRYVPRWSERSQECKILLTQSFPWTRSSRLFLPPHPHAPNATKKELVEKTKANKDGSENQFYCGHFPQMFSSPTFVEKINFQVAAPVVITHATSLRRHCGPRFIHWSLLYLSYFSVRTHLG